jgi:hypothetical protein
MSNYLTTVKNITHKTQSATAATSGYGQPECRKATVAGWIVTSQPSGPTTILCPKCFK